MLLKLHVKVYEIIFLECDELQERIVELELRLSEVENKVLQWSYNNGVTIMEWNLRMKDTLGAAMLSFVGRLSSLWRY